MTIDYWKPLTNAQMLELLSAGQGNAKVQYLLSGSDMEAAMKGCEGSHQIPDLTLARAIYVGAYMDTINRLSRG
jgi:hypothetical protein